MYAKSVIATTLLVILCIKLGQGLECYDHDYCIGNACKDILNTTKTCANKDTKCWKLTSPAGTKRGCGDSKCTVEINLGVIETANVCCSTNLCNSAIQIPITTVVMVLMILIAVINRSYFG